MTAKQIVQREQDHRFILIYRYIVEHKKGSVQKINNQPNNVTLLRLSGTSAATAVHTLDDFALQIDRYMKNDL
jgi:hypothetical protein